MQTLLAITFLRLGFKVIKNSIGVPDLLIQKAEKELGYAIEVKTSKEKVTLNQRELEAIKSINHEPVLAFLDYPAINPQWHFIDAKSIPKGTYERRDLFHKTKAMAGNEINDEFRKVLSMYHWNIINNPGYLGILFDQMGGKHAGRSN